MIKQLAIITVIATLYVGYYHAVQSAMARHYAPETIVFEVSKDKYCNIIAALPGAKMRLECGHALPERRPE
jgi:hypothetical protein